jgi:hypothetical protein
MPRLMRTALLSGLFLVAFAGQAQGATTLGQTFVPDPADNAFPCSGNTTYLQTASAPTSYRVTSAGVITAWSFQTNTAPPPGVKFKVGRLDSGNSYQIVGESSLKAPAASTLNTYTDVRVAVRVGDVIGFYLAGGDTACAAEASGYDIHYAPAADVPVNSIVAFIPQTNRQLDVAARLEPDADNDGFGDETQDGCPTNSQRQDDCVGPETRITKHPPNRLDRSKAKFKFTADEAGAKFECKVDRKRFKRCTSPKVVKRLDDGKHKFKVRAIDAAGNVDPSPAKDKFRVVD